MANERVTILSLGEGAVGKSSLTLSFLKRGFVDEYDPTVEDQYTDKRIIDGRSIDIELVDTAGQAEYRGLWAESHVKGADGFLFVYDVTNPATLTALLDFCSVVRNVTSLTDNPPPVYSKETNPFCFAVVGNKTDLPARQVTSQEGLAFAKKGGGLFFEASAKSGINVEQAYISLVKAILRTRAAKATSSDPSQFSPNVGMLDAAEERMARQTSEVAYDEKQLNESPSVRQRKKRKDLQLSRKHSQSIGGLGVDPQRYRSQSEKKSSCCVVV